MSKGAREEKGKKGRVSSVGKRGKGATQSKGEWYGNLWEGTTGRSVRSRRSLDVSPGGPPPRPSRVPEVIAEEENAVGQEQPEARPCQYRDIRLTSSMEVEARSISLVVFHPLERSPEPWRGAGRGRGAYVTESTAAP